MHKFSYVAFPFQGNQKYVMSYQKMVRSMKIFWKPMWQMLQLKQISVAKIFLFNVLKWNKKIQICSLIWAKQFSSGACQSFMYNHWHICCLKSSNCNWPVELLPLYNFFNILELYAECNISLKPIANAIAQRFAKIGDLNDILQKILIL